MKKVINGRLYNTDTAEQICDVSACEYRSDFRWEDTQLYRTKKGRWFLAGEGHAMSRWARFNGNTWGPGSGIQPIDAEEARELLERHASTDTVSRYFRIEEA